MKSIRDVLGLLDLKHRKSLRWGLLLLSTLLIMGASALVYAGMIYEKALRAGNTGGGTSGSGSTASIAVGFAPVAVMMLAVAGLVIGLSMFGFLREASRRISSAPGGLGLSPTGLESVSPGAPAVGLPLHLHSLQEEEWEESPAKDEDMESGQDNS